MSVASNCTNSRATRGVKFLNNPCPANQCKLAYSDVLVCRTCATSSRAARILSIALGLLRCSLLPTVYLYNNSQLIRRYKQCIVWRWRIHFKYLANIFYMFLYCQAKKLKFYLDDERETWITLSTLLRCSDCSFLLFSAFLLPNSKAASEIWFDLFLLENLCIAYNVLLMVEAVLVLVISLPQRFCLALTTRSSRRVCEIFWLSIIALIWCYPFNMLWRFVKMINKKSIS